MITDKYCKMIECPYEEYCKMEIIGKEVRGEDGVSCEPYLGEDKMFSMWHMDRFKVFIWREKIKKEILQNANKRTKNKTIKAR